MANRFLLLLVAVASCASGDPFGGGSAIDTVPTGQCEDLRMTTYADTGDRAGCGFSKSLPFIAPFVRDGMTTAIAEPFYGSSYHGDPGEACGECWLVTTPTTSAIIMVTNLCPTEGNEEWCGGDAFHFDLSEEATDALQGGWGVSAAARSVPCPLTGNIHIEVTDYNQWGYFQAAFVNFVIPIRRAEIRANGATTWVPMERVWGEVWAAGDQTPFATGGPGGTVRVTSAQGEVVTSDVLLVPDVAVGDTADLGVQFTDQLSLEDQACNL